MPTRSSKKRGAPLAPDGVIVKRAELLAEFALMLGSSWAHAECEATLVEHRRVAGGFPAHWRRRAGAL